MMATTKTQTFLDACREAVTVERDLREIDRRPANKLTGAAFVREAMRTARTTPEQVAAVRAQLDKEPENFQATHRFMRLVREFIINSSRPPRDGSRLGAYGRDECAGELAAVNGHPLLAFVVAAQQLVERRPESFGTCTDYDALERRRADLHQRRAALYARLSAPERDEIQIGDVHPDGYAHVTFRISQGAVPIVPVNNAGERLVAWLIANPKEWGP